MERVGRRPVHRSRKSRNRQARADAGRGASGETMSKRKTIPLGPPLNTPDEELDTVSYTHLRAHETVLDLVCRLLLEKNKIQIASKLHLDKITNHQEPLRTE